MSFTRTGFNPIPGQTRWTPPSYSNGPAVDPFALPVNFDQATFGGQGQAPAPTSNNGIGKKVWTAVKWTAGLAFGIVSFRYLRNHPKAQEFFSKIPGADKITALVNTAKEKVQGLFAEGSTLRKFVAAIPPTLQELPSILRNFAKSAYKTISSYFKKAPVTPPSTGATTGGTVV